jgi:hypothetical protein
MTRNPMTSSPKTMRGVNEESRWKREGYQTTIVTWLDCVKLLACDFWNEKKRRRKASIVNERTGKKEKDLVVRQSRPIGGKKKDKKVEKVNIDG